MTNETNNKKMNTQERKNYIKKNFWPALVGIVGFLTLYTAVSTEDARDSLPEKQAQELVSEKTTLLMGIGGVATMFGALAWGKKRNKERE